MKVHPNVPFNTLVTNLTNVSVHVPKHMVLSSSSNNMVKIIDLEPVDKKPFHTVAVVQAWNRPFNKNKSHNSANTNEDWRDSIIISPEYASFGTRTFNMFQRFREIWDGHLGQINRPTHRAILYSTETRLIHAVPHQASPKEWEAGKEEIDKILETKLIDSTQTERTSPIVRVLKPDRTSRLCLDYRKPNKVTTRFHIRYHELMNALIFLEMPKNSPHFTHIAAIDRSKCIKATVGRYCVAYTMACISIQEFSSDYVKRLLHFKALLMSHYSNQVSICPYLFGRQRHNLKNPEEHIKHTAIVIRLHKDASIALKQQQCAFFTNTIHYIGNIIRSGRLEGTSHTANAIYELTTPATVTEQWSLLGLCNVVRRFVTNFARIPSPLPSCPKNTGKRPQTS